MECSCAQFVSFCCLLFVCVSQLVAEVFWQLWSKYSGSFRTHFDMHVWILGECSCQHANYILLAKALQ